MIVFGLGLDMIFRFALISIDFFVGLNYVCCHVFTISPQTFEIKFCVFFTNQKCSLWK